MKEATGELNMTVVTVVAIAAVGAFFYAFIWPGIRESIRRNTNCANAICNCTAGANMCDCTYLDEGGNEQPVTCPNKDSDTAAPAGT